MKKTQTQTPALYLHMASSAPTFSAAASSTSSIWCASRTSAFTPSMAANEEEGHQIDQMVMDHLIRQRQRDQGFENQFKPQTAENQTTMVSSSCPEIICSRNGGEVFDGVCNNNPPVELAHPVLALLAETSTKSCSSMGNGNEEKNPSSRRSQRSMKRKNGPELLHVQLIQQEIAKLKAESSESKKLLAKKENNKNGSKKTNPGNKEKEQKVVRITSRFIGVHWHHGASKHTSPLTLLSYTHFFSLSQSTSHYLCVFCFSVAARVLETITLYLVVMSIYDCMFETGKWVAQISINSKRTHLGYFRTEIEAAKVYDVEALRLCRPTNTYSDNTITDENADDTPHVSPKMLKQNCIVVGPNAGYTKGPYKSKKQRTRSPARSSCNKNNNIATSSVLCEAASNTATGPKECNSSLSSSNKYSSNILKPKAAANKKKQQTRSGNNNQQQGQNDKKKMMKKKAHSSGTSSSDPFSCDMLMGLAETAALHGQLTMMGPAPSATYFSSRVLSVDAWV
jgi:hypothetical protein